MILNIEQFGLIFLLKLPNHKFVIGGADRDRTGDPLLAKQVLSQLSYSPVITD